MNKAYISLGSNEGQCLNNIQEAVVQIQKDIGVLTDLSSLYQTRSWGFNGPDFLNACIGIDTELPPLQVLTNLLKIEKQLGRVRSLEGNYKSRNIDLDLLFYENQIIELEGLILPHPRLELRNFIIVETVGIIIFTILYIDKHNKCATSRGWSDIAFQV